MEPAAAALAAAMSADVFSSACLRASALFCSAIAVSAATFASFAALCAAAFAMEMNARDRMRTNAIEH